MELFSGFAWPVPRAFAGAVAACRFEQGDVFYSDTTGYEPWKKGGPRPAQRIQVLDPPKTARALVAGDGDGKRFFSNWRSPVEVIRAAGDEPAGAPCVTTQGRLFTGLWRGDASWLEGAGDDPEPPLLQRDLHKRLEEAVGFFRKRFARRRGPHCLYLAAVDEASDASLAKAHGLELLLVERVGGKLAAASPVKVGLRDADVFHPALVLHAVAVPGTDPAPIENLLAGLLYAGSAGGAGRVGGVGRVERVEGSGRFSLSRHGLLVVPEAADEKS
ncbi:MAG: hypothetical protein JRE70_10480 [Deltaproteobacteria bacterium]|nr:hypothetical protein [Deltaproteobacteria bacterium]